MNRGRLTITLTAVALASTILAALALHESIRRTPGSRTVAQTYFTGFYSSTRLIDVDDVNLNSGEYSLSYAFDVNFAGPEPRARLVCGLKDPNGQIIRFEPDSTRSIGSSAAPQHVSFRADYALPYVAVGIRCHSTVSGNLTAHFSNVHLTARLLTGG